MTTDDREPIIDALLPEALGGAAPPDLSERILRAWSERRNGQARASAPRSAPLSVYADLTEPEPPPLVAGDIVRAVQLPTSSTGSGSAKRRRTKTWSFEVYACATAAAVLLIAFVGYRFAASPQANVAEVPFEKPTSPVDVAVREPQAPQETPSVEERPKPSPVPVQPRPEQIANARPTPPAPPVSPVKVSEKPQAVADAELVAFVNSQLQERWQAKEIVPSEKADDSEWCRRAFLRIVGRIPTVEELEKFTSNKSKTKHEELVDRLLNDSKYAEELAGHWAEVLANVLIGPSVGNDPSEPASRAGLEQYVRESLLAGKTYDRMAVELISATGAGQPGADNFNGAANFLLAHATDDAKIATARTSRVFLGVHLQCVQCHDHPTGPLKQESFWAMNGFFRQMKLSGNRNDPRELIDQDYLGRDGRDDEGLVFYELPNGIVKAVRPAFIDGTPLANSSGRVSDVNRRQELARLVVDSEYFSQTAVNRLWSHFLGYGFTRPVDDLVTGQPSHPEILTKLSEQFAAHDYDLKKAMRWIALSDAFNRSSKLSGEQLADMPEAGSPALFSRYYTRQLPAEEVSRSLQVAAKLRREAGPAGSVEQARVAWLAQVRQSDQKSPTIVPANTPLLKYATTNSLGNTLHQVTSSKNMKFEQKVEHLFLAALSRQPTPQERKLAQDLAGINGQNASAALEDIWWALLNSNEFALDH